MSPTELKKLRMRQRKARKAEERKQEVKRKEEKKAEQKRKQAGQDDVENPPQEELVPYQLERPTDALAEAMYFLQPLKALLPHRVHTHLLAFSVHLRREKPLVMLQCLKRAHRLEPGHPELHTCAVQFLQFCSKTLPRKYVQPPPPPQSSNSTPATQENNKNNKYASNNNKNSRQNNSNKNKNQQRKGNNSNQQNSNDSKMAEKKDASLPKVVNYEDEEALFNEQEASLVDVISGEMKSMFGDTMDPVQLNKDFLNKNGDSAPHRLQAGRSMVLLDVAEKNQAIAIATALDDHLKCRDLKTLESVLEWLRGIECMATTEEISAYKTAANKLFPRAQVFMSEAPPAHTTTITTTAATDKHLTTTTSATTTAMSNMSITGGDDDDIDSNEDASSNCGANNQSQVIGNHINNVAS